MNNIDTVGFHKPHNAAGQPVTRFSFTAVIVALGYLLTTWSLFFLSPFEWPVPTWLPVLLYVPFIFLTLAAGHLWSRGRTPRHAEFNLVSRTIWIGGLAAMILLIPSGQIYAGRWPWQVFEALADQRAAYQSLRESLAATEGGRGPIVLLRSLAAPFTFAVLPFGVIYWRRLSIALKMVVIGTVFSSIIFSILRGTTRELADLLVISSSAFLVATGRDPRGGFFKRNWGKILAGFLSVSLVFLILVGRAESRLGTNSVACQGETGICANLSTGVYGKMSDSVAFGATMITSYLSQGYYGLSLAMTLPYRSTLGIGHSPALQNIYINLTGDESLYYRSYVYRLRGLGWSDESQWSSLLVWLANDVSFIGVPFLIFLLGRGWGVAWVDATRGRDDRAAILFCVFMTMIFYLPANNQIMGVLENYAVLVVWLSSYLLSRRQARPIIG